MKPNCKCSNCGVLFNAKGNDLLLVLTGGRDCPECKKENGINLMVAYK